MPSTGSSRVGMTGALLAASLSVVDGGKMHVALPAIQESIGASDIAVQWIAAGYSAAFGVSLVPAGRYGDTRSRRAALTLGLSMIAVASGAAALISDSLYLVIARLVSGLGAGIMMPQAMGLIQQLTAPADRTRAFGTMGIWIGVSSAIGPVIGGFFLQFAGNDLGWRLLMLVSVPVAVLAIVLGLIGSPRQQKRLGADLDTPGAALLGLAILGTMVPIISLGSSTHWVFPLVGGLVAIAAGVGFFYWERGHIKRGRQPLANPALLKIRSFRAALLTAFFYHAAMPAAFLLATLHVQLGLGVNPLLGGFVMLPFVLSSAGSAALIARIVRGRSSRRALIVALLITIGGFGLMAPVALWVPPSAQYVVFCCLMAVAGVGGGAVQALNQTQMFAGVPLAESGVAASLGQLAQRFSNALGVAVCSTVYFATMSAFNEGVALAAGVLTAMACMTVAVTVASRAARDRP